jgi:hypothetical protein
MPHIKVGIFVTLAVCKGITKEFTMQIKVLNTVYETTDPKSIKALRGIVEDSCGKMTLREIANDLINNLVALNATKKPKKASGKLPPLYYIIGNYGPDAGKNFQVAIKYQPLTPNTPSARLITTFALSAGLITEEMEADVTDVKSITEKEYKQWKKLG